MATSHRKELGSRKVQVCACRDIPRRRPDLTWVSGLFPATSRPGTGLCAGEHPAGLGPDGVKRKQRARSRASLVGPEPCLLSCEIIPLSAGRLPKVPGGLQRSLCSGLLAKVLGLLAKQEAGPQALGWDGPRGGRGWRGQSPAGSSSPGGGKGTLTNAASRQKRWSPWGWIYRDTS